MISTVQCEGADFCEELSGASDTSFARFYEGDPPSRLLYSTKNFALLVDMSPLAVGHLLLLPTRHYLSFAQVLAVHPGETEDLISRIVTLYTKTFRSPLIMEHGSSAGQQSHACITHAHLHFLPIDGHSVDEFLIGDALDYKDLAHISELARDPWLNSAYFLRIYADTCRAYFPTAAQKRQYLRSVAGATLSIEDPEWDYAVVIRKNHLRTTMRMTGHWSEALSHNESEFGAITSGG